MTTSTPNRWLRDEKRHAIISGDGRFVFTLTTRYDRWTGHTAPVMPPGDVFAFIEDGDRDGDVVTFSSPDLGSVPGETNDAKDVIVARYGSP